MIEVRIPKEIREYKGKWLMGMTMRQLLCCLIGLIVNIPIYIGLAKHVGDELAGWVVLFTAAPFILVGFYKYNGMPSEELARCFINFVMQDQKRCYMTDNVYSWIKNEYEKENAHELDRKKKRKTKGEA